MDGDGEDDIDPTGGAAMDLDVALDLDLSCCAAKPTPRSALFQPKMKGKVKNEAPIRIKPDIKPSTHPASGSDPSRRSLELTPRRPARTQSSQGAVRWMLMEVLRRKWKKMIQWFARSTSSVLQFLSMRIPINEKGWAYKYTLLDGVWNERCDKLYILQCVLRPSWRPYELNERCDKVRVKPKKSKIEIDLRLDIDSENYDQEASDLLRLEKQVQKVKKRPKRHIKRPRRRVIMQLE